MQYRDIIILKKVLSEIAVAFEMLGKTSMEEFLNDEKLKRAVAMTVINIGELIKNINRKTDLLIRIFRGKQLQECVTLQLTNIRRCEWKMCITLSHWILNLCRQIFNSFYPMNQNKPSPQNCTRCVQGAWFHLGISLRQPHRCPTQGNQEAIPWASHHAP